MEVTRRTFLIATSAFTAVNLYHPMASAEIDPDNLDKARWYAVWFQPNDKPAVKTGDFNGLDKFPLQENSFLTFSDYDRMKIRTARPGQGLSKAQTTTTHFLQAREGSWG